MSRDHLEQYQLHELHVDNSRSAEGGEKASQAPSEADSQPGVSFANMQSLNDKKRQEIDTEQQADVLDNADAVIKTGADVSKYVVSLQDAGDPPLTFRGLVLGTLILILNSVITMIYTAKPVELSLSNVFIILVVFVLGFFWHKVFPKASWVEKSPRLRW